MVHHHISEIPFCRFFLLFLFWFVMCTVSINSLVNNGGRHWRLGGDGERDTVPPTRDEGPRYSIG